jgi:hypothetical protein
MIQFLHCRSPLVLAPVSRRFIDLTNGKRRSRQPQKYFFRPNPFERVERLWRRARRSRFAEPAMERTMKRTLIRYKTKPEMADENAELIAGVFAELKTARPDGVRYLSLRLDDNSFIHLVETEVSDGSSAIPNLAAFKAFQSGIRERCAEPPQVGGVTVVGNYRMLGES